MWRGNLSPLIPNIHPSFSGMFVRGLRSVGRSDFSGSYVVAHAWLRTVWKWMTGHTYVIGEIIFCLKIGSQHTTDSRDRCDNAYLNMPHQSSSRQGWPVSPHLNSTVKDCCFRSSPSLEREGQWSWCMEKQWRSKEGPIPTTFLLFVGGYQTDLGLLPIILLLHRGSRFKNPSCVYIWENGGVVG